MLNVQGLANLGKKVNNSLKKTTFSLLSFPSILHYPATAQTHSLCCLIILVKGFALSFDRTSQGSSYSKATCQQKLCFLKLCFSNFVRYLVWYLNINCDFHFSCIPCSGVGPQVQIMPAVTHTVHVPHTKIQGKTQWGRGDGAVEQAGFCYFLGQRAKLAARKCILTKFLIRPFTHLLWFK